MLTNLLLIANILVFVWTTLHNATASTQSLVQAGAFYGPYVQEGQWWRAFTTAFIHENLLHISFNMFALWQIGRIVEQLFGSFKMGLVYTASMIGSAWAIYTFNYDVVTVGASGAIFGLFGALVAAGLRLGPRGRQLVQSVLGIVIINVLIGFTVPNISQAGHLGGLVTGFIVGLLIYFPPVQLRRVAVDVQSGAEPVEAELLPPHQQQRP